MDMSQTQRHDEELTSAPAATSRPHGAIPVAGAKRKLLTISILSLVLFAALGEGLLQVHYRLKHGEWFAAHQASREFRVGYTVPIPTRREFSLRPGYTDANCTINAQGFRGPLLPATQEGLMICALGDSVPFGYGVGDDATYPAKLEQLMSQAGLAVKVLNAGVPSYNLRQSLDRYFEDVRPSYKPKVVIVHAANDMSLLTHYRDRWRPELTWASIRYRNTWESTGLARKLVLVDRLANWGGTNETEYFAPYPQYALLEFLDKELDTQLRKITEDGAYVILLPISMFSYDRDPDDTRNSKLSLWPRWHLHRGVFLPVATGINEMLRTKSKEIEGVYYLDVNAALDEHDRNPLFFDGFHYSGRGAEIVAQELFTFIDEKGLLDDALHDLIDRYEELLQAGFQHTFAERHEQAVAAYQEALEVLDNHRRSADAHLNLGWSLAKLGRFEEAVQHFERAIELVPDYDLAKRNLQWARSELAKRGSQPIHQ
jgi:tetratricopeptide (TPR) repeat protein